MNHDDTGRPDDLMEREVRDAYRALASERVPERLDRAVLAEAEAAARPRTSPILPWRRPLAWAATIALSFALLLEFTQTTPDLVPPADSPAPVEFDDRAADAVKSDSDALEEIGVAPAREEPAAPAVKSEAAKRERMQELEIMSAPQATIETKARGEAAPGAAPDFAVTASPELEESARESGQRALERQNLPQSQSLRTDQYVDFNAGEPVCDAEVRASADAWRRCIEDLFANERRAEAFSELQYFRRAFPDEPVPALN